MPRGRARLRRRAALGLGVRAGAWTVWGVLACAALLGLLTSLLRHQPAAQPGHTPA